MQTHHSKSTKKYQDNFDFIIPFLINDYKHAGLQKTKEKPSFKLTETTIVESNLKINNTNLVKIYSSKRQKKKSILTSNPQAQQSIIMKPNNYNTQVKTKVNKLFEKFPFFKTQSEMRYIHSNHINPKQVKVIPRNISSKEQRLASKESRLVIKGIIFKSKKNVNQSKVQMIQPETQFTQFNTFKEEIKTNLKYRKQRGEWDKKRCQNVDMIINRKCRTFHEHINEYQRRLQIDQGAKIFIFDSKDHWMRRVLINRGWIQNINRQSRAFHLYWSNKPYKQISFPQQFLNHYSNSDLITSKIGLHTMLKKYNLLHLQPTTFDLSSQKTQFILQYNKIHFISKLKKIMSKIQFQGKFKHYNLSQLQQKIKQILSKNKFQKYSLQYKLMYIIEICFSLLDNGQIIDKDVYEIEDLYEDIKVKFKLSMLEEQMIRILQNLEELMKSSDVVQDYFGIGMENIWIIKSKASSKGVGISIHKDYDQIVKHNNKLAQKYIENPLIFNNPSLKGRKFDVRIWVLVTGTDNPSIYYHQKFYGRICYQPYSIQTINLNKQQKHLTNFSHNKHRFHHKKLSQSIFLPQHLFTMIQQQIKIDYRSKFYIDVQRMLKKMQIIFKNQITKSSVNNFELFGFDLLIDESLHMHLLEVNLSAHCQERHQELTIMLEDMGNGIIDILQYEKEAKLYGWKVVC